LTEVNSHTLTYHWDDGSGDATLTSVGGDSWSLGGLPGPQLATTPTTLAGQWDEPEGSSSRNTVAVIFSLTLHTWSVGVVSDTGTNGLPHHANGETASGELFNVQFTDRSDVPEGGTTVIMLSLAVGCLALVRRRIA